MAKQKTVQVIEKNQGAKIAWEQSGTKLIFGDDELMVNAARYQRDWAVQLDVCADKAGNLVIGVGVGRYYVAQLNIPPTRYDEVEAEDDTAAEVDVAQETGAPEDERRRVQRVARALDMGEVILTLWSMEDLQPAVKQ